MSEVKMSDVKILKIKPSKLEVDIQKEIKKGKTIEEARKLIS
jgi:hypothetical protein